jgi:hypothetical protein
MQPDSKQRLGKHATKTRVLVETVFFIRSMQSGYKEDLVGNQQSSSGVPSEQLVSRELGSTRKAEKMAL